MLLRWADLASASGIPHTLNCHHANLAVPIALGIGPSDPDSLKN
jgi:hypothetical protein